MGLNPNFPLVTGDLALTKEWQLSLPVEFSRRMEDGDLVFWRPGLTFWICIWRKNDEQTSEELLTSMLSGANPTRRDEQIERSGGLIRLTYETDEEDPSRQKSAHSAISADIISQHGSVQISAHYDTPETRTMGYQIIHTVRCA